MMKVKKTMLMRQAVTTEHKHVHFIVFLLCNKLKDNLFIFFCMLSIKKLNVSSSNMLFETLHLYYEY